MLVSVSEQEVANWLMKTGVHAVEVYVGIFGYLACEVNFVYVFLSVGETESPDFFEVGFCPKEAGGGVLPSAENNEGAFVVEVLHCFGWGGAVEEASKDVVCVFGGIGAEAYISESFQTL